MPSYCAPIKTDDDSLKLLSQIEEAKKNGQTETLKEMESRLSQFLAYDKCDSYVKGKADPISEEVVKSLITGLACFADWEQKGS